MHLENKSLVSAIIQILQIVCDDKTSVPVNEMRIAQSEIRIKNAGNALKRGISTGRVNMRENGSENQSGFRMLVRGKTVSISFRKTESEGIKDKIRDIFTDSLEERYLALVQQTSEEEKSTL